MDQEQVLQLIRQWIVKNGNREITADVLRPILEAMVVQPNQIIGDPDNLGTQEKSSMVGALNEILDRAANGNIAVYTGSGTPEQTPPESFEVGDFYVQAGNEGVLGFYQYNGFRWVSQSGKTPRPVELYLGRVPTAGETTTESEIRNHINRKGFEVEPDTITILNVNVRNLGNPSYVRSYFFTGTDTAGTWGTGSQHGEISADQLILNTVGADPEAVLREARKIEVGEIGEMSLATYLNENEEPVLNSWRMEEGESTVFYYSQQGRDLAALYVGAGGRLGETGDTVAVEDDFALVMVGERTVTENTLIPDDGSITITNDNRIRVNVEGWNLKQEYLEKLNF